MLLGLFIEKLRPKVCLWGYDILFAYLVVYKQKAKYLLNIIFYPTKIGNCGDF